MWLEARDDGTDGPDGEHSTIHQVGGVILSPDDADGEIQPDEDDCRRERDADAGSLRMIFCHPHCQLVGGASADDQGAGDSEIGFVLVRFIDDLHCDQRQQQQKRCNAPARDPPTAPAPSVPACRVSCHCLASRPTSKAFNLR
jgi:hypothetical protein